MKSVKSFNIKPTSQQNHKNENLLQNWLNQFFVLFCFFAFYMFLVSVIWFMFTGSEVNKTRDQIFAILFLMFPFLAAANWNFFKNSNSFNNRYFPLICWSLLTSVVVIWALLWNEPFSDGSFRSYVNKWWPGFSVLQFILGCSFAAIFLFAVMKDRASKILFIFKLATPFALIYYIALWLEFPWGVRELSSPVLEEILSPSAGALPAINFTAQYINLLGLPIMPITFLFPKSTVLIAYIWIDMLKIGSLVFAIYFLRITTDKKWIPLFLVLILALSSISGLGQYYHEGNSANYWATFPIRLFLPMGLGALLMREIQGPLCRNSLLFLGILASITALNNADWGIPAASAALLVLLLGASNIAEGFRRFRYFFSGVIILICAYSITLRLLCGYWPDPVALTYFAIVFIKSGMISFPMQGWGLHVIVLGTFAFVSAIGIIGYSGLGASLYNHRSTYFAGLVYMGIFSLGTSLYFINRALLPVLKTLFFPWALCIALMTYGAIKFVEKGRNIATVYTNIIFLTLPVFILLGVAFSSILNGPRFSEEWVRITSSYPGSTTPAWLYSIEPRSKIIENKIKNLGERSRIGLIANNSNAIASRLGIKSLSGFWSPMPLDAKNTNNRICWAIKRSRIKYLLVDPIDVYPELIDMFQNCLGQDGDLILMGDHAEYQFIASNASVTSKLEAFPASLPMIEVELELTESKNIDSVNIFSPNGLGNWTTFPIKNTWGIGVVNNAGGSYKMDNEGQRKARMNIAHGRKLSLWFPDNGNLTRCPELRVEIFFEGGDTINTIARCKVGFAK